MDDLFDINEDFADVELNLGLDDPQPETIPQQDLPLLESKLTTDPSSTTPTQQTIPLSNDPIPPPSSTNPTPPQPQQEEPKPSPLPKPKPKIPTQSKTKSTYLNTPKYPP